MNDMDQIRRDAEIERARIDRTIREHNIMESAFLNAEEIDWQSGTIRLDAADIHGMAALYTIISERAALKRGDIYNGRS